MRRRSCALAALACALVFGPERFPLDGGVHTEIRVQVCTQPWGYANAYLTIGMRTYERTQNKDGSYTDTVLSTGEDGWTDARISLWITTQEPAP